MKFGLVVDNLDSIESKKLYNESLKLFDNVVLLDNLKDLLIILERNNLPKIHLIGEDISDIDLLMIRSTKKYKLQKTVLAKCLKNCGCNIIDPDERFKVGFASKILSSIGRHEKNCMVDTYMSFSHRALSIRYLRDNNINKVFVKPVTGAGNRGTHTFNIPELFEFSNQYDYELPLFIQKFIEIDKEYRVFVVDGRVIAFLKKIRKENGRIKYKRMTYRRLGEYVRSHVSEIGVLGVDACKDINGDFYIIEANRSPMFRGIEKKTGINISYEILRRYNHEKNNSRTVRQEISSTQIVVKW